MQALNYSTQAIGDLRAIVAPLAKEKNWPEAAGLCESIADKIEASHKFLLPFGGRLFDDIDLGTVLPVFRLPFPVITIESTVADAATNVRIKILIVCHEVQRASDVVCAIWALQSVTHRHVPQWYPLGGLAVAYGQTPKRLENGHYAFNWQFLPIGEVPIDDDSIAQNNLKAAGDSVFQLCAALKCSNVSTERLDPPVKLQAKRAKEGKLPLFSYHILTVGNANPTAHTGATGSHSSPRTHLRRGHIRNHPTAGFVWVQSCVVNPGAKGSVNKDYAVVRG